MNILISALAAGAVLATPLAASAQDWGDHRGGWDRDHDRGEHRGQERGEHRGWNHRHDRDDWRRDRYAYRYGNSYYGNAYYGGHSRCWVQSQAYRTWYGDIQYRQVRICR